MCRKSKLVTIRAAYISAGAVVLAAIIYGVFSLIKPENRDKPIQNEFVANDSSNVSITNNQNDIAGDFIQGDKNVTINNVSPKEISSILIELRTTCSLKHGAKPPPTEYTFIPTGDANSYFTNQSGKFKVDFLSPVKFRRLDNDNIVIINRFMTNTGSDLLNKPISFLSTFDSLHVPIISVSYGKDFDKLYSVELSLRVNDEDIWYESWQYNMNFQSGSMHISLDNLKLKLRNYN